MTREEFIAEHPIEVELERRGVTLIGSGNTRKAKCPFHEDGNPSFSVDVGKGLWKCFGGCGGGSVIDLIGMFDGIDGREVLRRSGDEERRRTQPLYPTPSPKPQPRRTLGVLVCHYVYEDAFGKPSFRVARYEPKDFRQEAFRDGAWTPSMDGVERVLYRLPSVLKSQEVWVVEGEKDADNLSKFGFCATTNVGGGGNWKEGYSEWLSGKDVVICTDQDAQGVKHQSSVFESVSKVARTVKIVNVPKPHKDVSDLIKADSNAKSILHSLCSEAVPHVQGIKLPLYSMAEMEAAYIEHVKNMATDSFNLSRWLPSLNRVRALIPGELVMFVGNTGIGKTALLCSLAMATRSIPVVMFQLELPPELIFERMLAAKCNGRCMEIEHAYGRGDYAGEALLKDKFPNIQICCESGLSLERIEQIIVRAELKMGHKPKMVLIDYVQLLGGSGENRRDKFSNIAEGLKVLAKRTRTIVVIASQIARPSGDSPEIGLHDAKETGSLENSCGMVFGAWRNPEDARLMHLRLLKSTKGGAGLEIACNYDGPSMRITERSMINDVV